MDRHPLQGDVVDANRRGAPDVAARSASRRQRLLRWLESGARSLTFRMSLYCALLAGVTLAAVLALSYHEFSSALRERAYAELSAERDLIMKSLSTVSGPDAIRGKAGGTGALRLDHAGLSVVVLPGESGPPLVSMGSETPEMLTLDLARGWKGIREVEWEQCLLAITFDRTSLADGTPVRMAVAIERTGDRAVLAGHRWRLLLFWTVGILLIGALAAVIAQRSIAPLNDFTSQVSAISADRLGRRVSASGVPVELRPLAATFNDLLGRLDDAFRRLEGFSADIAHELRSPITNLVMKTQVTLSRPRSAEEYRHALESNAEELDRMHRMVADMLFIARADDPSTGIARLPIDARALADQLAEFLEPGAHESGVTIEVTGRATLLGDGDLVRRALSNLLTNALRHSPRGGTVRVRISVEPGNVTAIEVVNDGPGIPAGIREYVFDRFVRGDASRQRTGDGAGMGLGLAIVRSIMKLHGGRVTVDTCDAGPTAFRLEFGPASRRTSA